MRVLAAGARTAIGATLDETSTSLRAGIQRFRRAPFVDDAGEAFLVAPVLEMSRKLEGTERGVLLAKPALADLASHRHLWEGRRAGLILALDTRWPPPSPSHSARLCQWLEDLEARWRDFPGAMVALLQSMGFSPQSHVVAAVRGDPSAFTLGLNAAKHWLESGAVDVCLLGSVAASCEAPWLMLLDEHELTHASRRDGGVVIGEAAAFILVGNAGPGRELEVWSRSSELDGRALRTETIAHALKEVVSAAQLTGPQELPVILDSNGRVSRTKKWSFAQTRALGTRKITVHKFEPATFLGDVGVATLPLYIALASRLSAGSTLVGSAHGIGEAASFVVLSERT